MSELVPYADFKRVQAERNGLPFHDYEQPLTSDEVNRLNAEADVQLFFAPHGSDPHDYHAVHEVISHVDPRHTLVATEQLGYNPNANNPTSIDRQDLPSPLKPPNNTHQYIQQYCQSNGIPLVRADFDSLDYAIWQRSQKTGANHLPNRNKIIEELMTQGWLSLDFMTAAEEYATRSASSNWDRVKGTEYNWGALSHRREQVAVDTLVQSALQRLQENPHVSGEKLKVLLFFGTNHQPGIEEEFTNKGLRFTSYTVNSNTSTFTQQERSKTRQEYDARAFAQQFFWKHTQQGEGLNVTYSQFSVGLREVPIEWLATIYEAYRNAVAQTAHLPDSQRGAHMDNLSLQLSQELYNAAQRVTTDPAGA